jgi:hypothetical protein
MLRRLVAVLAPSLLASCFSYGAIHSYRTEEGRPVADPGPDDAYLVWHDGAGWHLRARAGASQVFEGTVAAAGLRQVSVVGIAPEAVKAGNGVIAFSFVGERRTGDAGFDWQGDCAEFSLFVGPDARPMRVFAGAFGASPPRVPFQLCPS